MHYLWVMVWITNVIIVKSLGDGEKVKSRKGLPQRTGPCTDQSSHGQKAKSSKTHPAHKPMY